MHVKALLHKVYEETSINRARLNVLLLASGALLEHNKLTVTGLGRSIIDKNKTKHNINKMNRLVGNKLLYKDNLLIYKTAAEHILGGKRCPVILVDWSSVTPGERHQLLRAAFAVKGRAIPVYEQVYELSDYNSQEVHNRFLETLKKILPKDCRPIIVTDAGFSVPWFAQVRKLGWDFIGRVSNMSSYKDETGKWKKIRDLLGYNQARVKRVGEISLTKRHHLPCYLQLYRKPKKYRTKSTINGEKAARSVSVKSAERESQAWVIVSSLGKNFVEAKQVIKFYGFRMQIEESFRDLKSHQFGMGLRDSRTQGIVRLTNLLIIAFLAYLMAWLIGLCGKNQKLQYAFQANSIKTKDILSVVFLARELVKHNKHRFRKAEWSQALFQLRELADHA